MKQTPLSPQKLEALEAKLKVLNDVLSREPAIRAAVTARKPETMKNAVGIVPDSWQKAVAFKFGHRDFSHAMSVVVYNDQWEWTGGNLVSLASIKNDAPLCDDDIESVASTYTTAAEAYDAGVEDILGAFTRGLRKNIEFLSRRLAAPKAIASPTSSRPKP